MTVASWLDLACADADRRHLPALRPLLETLARATEALRAADWNERPVVQVPVNQIDISPRHAG